MAGTFGAPTGLGASARHCFQALEQNGLAPIPIDLTTAMLQRNQIDPPRQSQISGRGCGTVIMHINAPLVPLALLNLGRAFLRDKKIVGYWHWELESTPSDWLPGPNFVHEIWVPSEFVRRAVEKITSKPVHVLPHPIFDNPRSPAINTDRLTVLTLFDLASSFERKNPAGAVKAFKAAFGDSHAARMIIKVTNHESFPEGMQRLRSLIGEAANIEIRTDILSEEAFMGLIESCDILLSLHRAEGFGMPQALAMAAGKVVIGTGWSSTAEYMTQETSRLVPFRFVPVNDPQHTYNVPGARWADPDVEAASKALRELADDPELREQTGGRAIRMIRERFSPEEYCRRLQSLLA